MDLKRIFRSWMLVILLVFVLLVVVLKFTGSNQYHSPGNAYSWTWDTSTAGVYAAGDSCASYICRDPAATESPGADSCAEYNGELHAACYVDGLGGCRQPGLVTSRRYFWHRQHEWEYASGAGEYQWQAVRNVYGTNHHLA